MKKNFNYIYMFLMPAVFLSSLGFSGIGGINLNLEPVLISFLLFYFITMLKAVILIGILKPYTMYLATSLFFIYSRLLFDVFGNQSFLIVSYPIYHVFDAKIGMIFLCSAFVSHYVIDVFYFVHFHTKQAEKRIICLNNESLILYYPKIQKLGIILMIVFTVPRLFKLYIQLNYVRTHGYLSLYNGELDSLEYPIWVSGSGTMFLLGFYLVLFSRPSIKTFIYTSILYMFCQIFGSLQGGRASFISSLLTLFVLYSMMFNKKIKLKRIILLFIFVVVFSVFMGFMRENKSVGGNLTRVLTAFFYGQSTSIVMPLTMIEYKTNHLNIPYHTYPFIFNTIIGYVIGIIRPPENSNDALQNYNSLGAIFTYMMNPSMYYKGRGTGGSILAEMYDFGSFFGVVLWSAVLGMLFKLMDSMLNRSNILILFFLIITSSIIFSPRGTFFGFFYQIQYVLAVLLIILSINFILYPKKINNHYS